MPGRDALDWDSNRSSNSLINKRLQTMVSNPLPLKSRRMQAIYSSVYPQFCPGGDGMGRCQWYTLRRPYTFVVAALALLLLGVITSSRFVLLRQPTYQLEESQ